MHLSDCQIATKSRSDDGGRMDDMHSDMQDVGVSDATRQSQSDWIRCIIELAAEKFKVDAQS